ncbi:GIY-YIG nuclease family protein [Paenibacillus glycanilyticus]|uniref:GIY-YIG nuclease family protein n=1 Tax=Paenibacillus glycanilyticus TaxID=126569 RepID=UPI00203AEB2A|nr:GIY-YIG nuclease family protein [Paenibacillus glycanilyticus]
MEKQRKRELGTAYAQSFRRMGIYQIKNVENGKILVLGTMDLEGAKNRLAFMQQTNMNTVFELQQDWNKYGGSSFAYEELDTIKPREEHLNDRSELKKYQAEVDALLELWLEKLQPYDEAGYNRRPRAN